MDRYKLNIAQWGPAGWDYLTAAAFAFPGRPSEKDKEHFRTFFEMNGYVIPCGTCRKHWQKNIEKDPVDVSSRRALVEWINRMHNAVNRASGKPEMPVLGTIAAFIPPGLAKSLLKNPKEQAALEEIDALLNAQAEEEATEDAKFHISSVPWWLWLIFVLTVLILVIFLVRCQVWCKKQ